MNVVFVIFHILGVAIGAGAAFTGDFIFFASIKDKVISKEENKLMDAVSTLVWFGLGLILLSGVGLVWLRPEIFLRSEKFWAKMTVVLVIAINGLIFRFVHRKTFAESIGVRFEKADKLMKNKLSIIISGALSMISWVYTIILGVLSRTPFSYAEFIFFYMGILVIAFFGAVLLKDRILSAN